MAAHRWDELRRSVLRDAVVNLLLPAMEREARSSLAADARAVVLEAAADRLWHYASQAPLQVSRGCGRGRGRPVSEAMRPPSAFSPPRARSCNGLVALWTAPV